MQGREYTPISSMSVMLEWRSVLANATGTLPSNRTRKTVTGGTTDDYGRPSTALP